MTAAERSRAASEPVVSVVVPVFNAADTIGDLLRALGDQQLQHPFEVIVVDGGSTDGTLKLLTRAGDSITLLDNPLREPASSRNLGVDRARAAVIAFTDADCQPTPTWLKAGLRALADGSLDVVQGRVIPQREPGPFDRTLAVSSEYGLYETANLFIRSEVFERAGGFEILPGLELAHGAHFGEDAWLVWRARRQGARTAFCSDATVRHAVVERGIRVLLRETIRRRYFPHLVRMIPELRGAFLHRGWFLGPTSLHFDLASTSVLIAASGRRRRPALLLALPYVADRWGEARRYPRRTRPTLLLGRLAEDATGLGALLWGSLAARTPVL